MPTSSGAHSLGPSSPLSRAPPKAQVRHRLRLGSAPHQQVYPPSTRTMLPVIRLAASDARNRTTDATSSGSPMRPIGVPPSQAALIAGSDSTNRFKGVLM